MPSEERIRELTIKKSRRNVLTVLKMVYPGSFGFRDIALSLPALDEHLLRIDISYLIAKGYIEWINQGANMNLKHGEYRLTARGVETADRINKDPALEP